MQKFLSFFYHKPILILLILILPSFVSLIRPGFFSMHDDLQAFRIHQMNECFKDFQLPCRWVPDMGYQYGYPQYNFYPPSVYYLGEFFHLIGFQFIDSVKILFALGFIFSALTMYLFLKNYLSRWTGVFGALIYTYAPYKAVNVYVRGALNEFWALVFYPLIFYTGWKLIKEGGRKNLALFGLSLALLLLTHNLMTIVFLPVLAVWLITNIILEKKYKSLISLCLGGFLGLGLASFFTLPLILEKPYAHLETLIGGYFDYRQHFVSLYQLFISNFWGYGSSVWGVDDGLSLSAGHIQIIAAIFTLILAIFNFKKFKKLSIMVFVLFITEVLALFMIHQKSSPIWTMFESVLIFLQFPWRFLSISTFLATFLAAIGIFFIEKLGSKTFKIPAFILYGIILVLACLILYLPFFKPVEWLNISDKDKFSGGSWKKQLTISIFDYLPIYAKFPPTSNAPQYPETLEGLGDFKSSKKGSDYKMWTVDISQKAILRAPMFDFPGMKVWIDGKEVKHVNDDCRNEEFCLGLVTFPIDPGNHEILVKLQNTPVRLIGNIVSLLSFITAIGLIFGTQKYFKKWLS